MKAFLILIIAFYVIYNVVLAYQYYRDSKQDWFRYSLGYVTQLERVTQTIVLVFFGLPLNIYYNLRSYL